ncbi:MAG: hypothetical protein F9B45_24085 [Phycisphaera sp. RhM]|nr:hypothetical protein [Phycisphaera sp. RhM]
MTRLLGCLALAAVFTGVINAGEPFFPLRAEDGDRLRGRVSIDGREFAMELVDRDQDGVFAGQADRLLIDFDDDGRLHPLREKYATNRPLRLRGFNAAEHFELQLLENPLRARLIPIQGMGTVEARLDALQEDAVLSKLTATLVSKSGIHRTIDSLHEAIAIPVGSYRVEEVLIEAKDGRYWAIGFRNSDINLAYSIEITKDQLTSCELLGGLSLSARVAARDYFKGKLTVLPSFVTDTGLTLVNCRVGQLEPSDESRLAASLVGIDDAQKVIDRRSSGFACKSLCPLVFETHDLIDPQMDLVLKFDIGPLGGVIRHSVPVRSTGYQPLGKTIER